MRSPQIPKHLSDFPFDAIIIGAGINGVGIARDAALRGLKVLVLDKGDIGSGTSSWSSRLVHGGLRYLEHAEFGLVRESLREREALLRLAPHLVRPLRFMIPFYAHNRRGPLTMRAGMLAYDLLSYDKSLQRHTILSRAEALRQMPGLNPDGLTGAAVYYDAQVSMAERLCVENALSAADHGARILTYARVDRIHTATGAVQGVEFTDLLTGTWHSARAPLIINVAGPWVDRVVQGADAPPAPRLIGGTKGSHLVVDPFPGAPDQAVHYEAMSDGRAVLVIPWEGRYLIGSTDIRYDGDPDLVSTEADEVEYLVRETNHLIPSARLSAAQVAWAYVGVRPLPYQEAGPEASITRRHIIHEHGPGAAGLISIIGGKLTTYRSLAEETVNLMFRRLGRRPPRCSTAQIPLPGAGQADLAALSRLLAESVPAAAAERLVRLYGLRAPDVIALAAGEPDLLRPLHAGSLALGAEIVIAFRNEFAQTLTDALARRTMVGLESGLGLDAAVPAARAAVRHLGWNEERAEAEVAAYRQYAARFRLPGTPAAAPGDRPIQTLQPEGHV